MSKSEIKRLAVQRGVTMNVYAVIDRAVEEGVAYGYTRAHKHVARPDEATMREHMHREVMTALCEVLRFDDECPAILP